MDRAPSMARPAMLDPARCFGLREGPARERQHELSLVFSSNRVLPRTNERDATTFVRSDALSAHKAKVELHRRIVCDRHKAANAWRCHVELAPGKGERANRLDLRV